MNGSNTLLRQELWRHPAPETTEMDKFRRTVNKKRGLDLKTFQELHEYSVSRTEFWDDAWEYANFIHEGKYDLPCDFTARMDSIPKWFQGIYLNHAENILFKADPKNPSIQTKTNKEDSKIAITEIREGGTEIRHVSWGELRTLVGQYASAMRNLGVKAGDVVAACATNQLTTLVVFLATTSLGGITTSSAPDMGTKGVLDRLTQVEPMYLFMDDWFVYNGKKVDLRGKLKNILRGMQGIRRFKGAILIPRFGTNTLAGFEGISNVQTLSTFLSNSTTSELFFTRLPFHAPLGILYSSGTTGQPKCMVHSIGGILLIPYVQQAIHYSAGPNSVQLQYTITGWVGYYACVQYLVMGGRSILYDGSLFRNKPTDFIRLIGEQGITQLGISPRYLQELENNNLHPKNITDCSKLQIVVCAGMVLSTRQFLWFYKEAFPPHVHLANLTGGTDSAAGFALGNPLTPVYPSGCQGLGLGFKMEVYEDVAYEEGGPTIKGKSVPSGCSGELVCSRAFPSMPITFLGKDGHRKYHEAYFAKYDDVWTHGDFVTLEPFPNALSLIVHGRSDGVLNPFGVRFGSAEIYSILESLPLNRLITDSLVIGQRRAQDTDEHVVLFLMLKPGVRFNRSLIISVKNAIAGGLSKRHVPRYVFEVPQNGIPVTINGKKVENPIKRILCGKRVSVSPTIANPECVAFYYDYCDVESRQRELDERLRRQGEHEMARL